MQPSLHESIREQYSPFYLGVVFTVGTTGLRQKKMYMSTDEEKQPTLPVHDFATNKLFITPAAHRFIRKVGTGQIIDGE